MDYQEVEIKIIEYGLYLFNEEDSPVCFVCGPANPSFYYDESDLDRSALRNIDLEFIALQACTMLSPDYLEQLDLFPSHPRIPVNEFCAAFLLKYEQSGGGWF